jgi:DNA-binding MarR family transcriptional regulator
MQAAGCIERIRNPADERQVFVELTERGKSLEDRAGCLVSPMTAVGPRRKHPGRPRRPVSGVCAAGQCHLETRLVGVAEGAAASVALLGEQLGLAVRGFKH